MNQYVTVKELAQRSRMSERTLRKFIKCGEFPHYRPDPKGKILIRPSDFDMWIDSRRVRVAEDVDAKEMLELLFAAVPRRRSA